MRHIKKQFAECIQPNSFQLIFKGSTFPLRQEVDTNKFGIKRLILRLKFPLCLISPLLAELHYLCTVKIDPYQLV